MKSMKLAPVDRIIEVHTQGVVLEALLCEQLNLMTACGGKGLCATCHVHVDAGMEALTPKTPREEKTLSRLSQCEPNSRLACQCRVLADGAVIRLPQGVFIEKAEDLELMVGQRAEDNILHPIDGSVLIARGKLITRTRLRKLEFLRAQVEALRLEV